MYPIIISVFIYFLIRFLKTVYKFNNPIIISVDGNIGSGKSTLIQILKESNIFPNYTFIDEPISDWTEIKDANGINLLGNFYTDKKRWSYSFQNFAFITRSRDLLHTIEKFDSQDIFRMIKNFWNNKKNVCFTERSTLTDRYVFAEMLYDSGHMSKLEWAMYMEWYNLFKEKLKIDHVIYIKTNPEISFERVNKRSRSEEKSLSQDYLIELHTKHEKWLSLENNVLTINGNVDFETEEANRINIIDKIKKYIENIDSEVDDNSNEWINSKKLSNIYLNLVNNKYKF
ncbi:Deoxynucleoside kinase [seawater metagenome]|uniref:Deoxynucleoside kinase n=1 Tax=seawater metagenome TaxID=1561972 RepID=A0A5E8CMG5_9ZZZZ